MAMLGLSYDGEYSTFVWAVDMRGNKISGWADQSRTEYASGEKLRTPLRTLSGVLVDVAHAKPSTQLHLCDSRIPSQGHWVPVVAYSENESWIDEYLEDKRLLQVERERAAQRAKDRVTLQDLVGEQILQVRADYRCIAFVLSGGRNWAFDFDAYVDPDRISATRPWIATNGGKVTEIGFEFSTLTIKTDRFPFTTMPMKLYCPSEAYEEYGATALYDGKAKELRPERLRTMRIISGGGVQVDLHA